LPVRKRAHEVLLAATLTAGFATQGASAFAQDYPSRPITLIVPYAAGGGNDLMARTAAERMSRTLGQQIVIENRGGAGGSIATRQIAKAAPDGYTLGLGGTGTLAINPTLYGNVGYDPRRDFAPIGLILRLARRVDIVNDPPCGIDTPACNQGNLEGPLLASRLARFA
jgi:tripartite-type tricarboxylate transporter receptor subunit TctC